ncbi:glycosyltransferase family 1 protein [Bipolaris oryzae ATCC 44560]|uniref:Glycosyltransferase family 1 protein n=1 Tax=Bipolaris oryzae ATCC 44560 TaxID=930090 RepID=W6YVZ2_COCMI|nr:glycosyltransferase family 1 protein [Bipolaris oryzae ATCC 44560]EUC43587.1 glycosyltransferase family 1 protein [Bipolaris oryzae ATCC 44560]
MPSDAVDFKHSKPPPDEVDFAWDTPPPYELHSSSALLDSSCTVQADGTLNIDLTSSAPFELEQSFPAPPPTALESDVRVPRRCPRLNVVVHVVGSRGDVQPFIALGTALQQYGHRVRLATHDVFADFVRKSGLEFYPIGGDPEELMSYMVRNPGLLPSLNSLKGGDIPRKRRMIHEMLQGCWNSCLLPDPVSNEPFVANAIIANPPSFAHVHCAQALGVPVHMMFTMPWTATRAFPHPLTNVKARDIQQSQANYLSYGVVNMMTWQGLGDVINLWRTKDLGLDPVHPTMGPDLVDWLKLPVTYCWSPALVPKPQDWGPNIDICGFFMREEPVYTPPEELSRFLHAGDVPVYVGFGSIVLENAKRMTEIILEACKKANVRVIISRGWSKLGGNDPNTENVFYLGDCPHEWLFKQVSAVVHHGGAGTTACGLYNARPTVIVPFFGDQPFWGNVVASNGAGPAPIPHKSMSSQNLAEAIEYCLSSEAQQAARAVADQMRRENGVDVAVQSFHRHVNSSNMNCDTSPQDAADWVCRSPGSGMDMKLSHAALRNLTTSGQVKLTNAIPYRPKEYNMDVERWDPLTAGASATLGIVTDFTSALGGTFVNPFKKVRQARLAGSDGASSSLAAAGAVGQGVAAMATSISKGALVSMPLALAEGLRQAPKLYGDEVKDHGKVKDWKSGGVVAAKNFGTGFYEGLTDIVTKPREGAKKEGALGFMKGVGKGSLNLVAKPGSAMFGLMAYPAQGIYKSIKSSQKNAVPNKIRAEKIACFHCEEPTGRPPVPKSG